MILGCHVDTDQLRKELTDYIDNKLDRLATTVPGVAKPTVGFQRVMQRAVLRIINSGRDEVTGANVVVALFAEPESHAVNILQQQGMTRIDAESYIVRGLAKPSEASPEAADLAFLPPAVRAEMQDAQERFRKSRLTPSLEQSIRRAISLATERHHEYATLEHLLLSLTEDQDAASVISGLPC